MANERRQVLAFTLTELFALLFFALALALAGEAHARKVAEDHGAALVGITALLGEEGAKDLAEFLAREPGPLPDDFLELIRRASDVAEARAAIEEWLREWGRDSTEVAEASTEELIEAAIEEARESLALAEALAEAADLSGGERSLLDAMASELAVVRREAENLRGQVTNLVHRLGGLDHPPCWTDDDGRIEYAFEATLYTRYIDLVSIWPPHRNDDAARVPGMLRAAGTQLPHEDFRSRARPILDWSRQQDPECRHFVRLVDRVPDASDAKEAFKRGLLTVEGFFYKLLVD